jgi:hypothetical protein
MLANGWLLRKQRARNQKSTGSFTQAGATSSRFSAAGKHKFLLEKAFIQYKFSNKGL